MKKNGLLVFFVLMSIFLFTSCVNVNTEYEVAFDLNGGLIDGQEEWYDFGLKNEQIVLPIPLRNGFAFLAWEDENGKEYIGELTIKNNVTLIAKWLRDDLYITEGLIIASNNDYCFVASYEGEESDVIIPQTYLGKEVREIASHAFGASTFIQSVYLPLGMQTIGDYAFADCEVLTQINLPSTLVTIGSSAFSNCGSIKTLDIPNNVKTINPSTFENCRMLETIRLPNDLQTIGQSAFSGCYNLTDIDFPASLIGIGGYAFKDCLNLTSVILPEGLKSIGDYAFYACENIIELSLPHSLLMLGDWSFAYCGIVGEVIISKKLTSLGKQAFTGNELISSFNVEEDNLNYCSIDGNLYAKDESVLIQFVPNQELDQFIVPSSVNTIASFAFAFSTVKEIIVHDDLLNYEDYAFAQAKGLESIDLPQTLTVLSAHMFQDCVNLAEINLPQALITINEYAFSGCGSLKEIEFASNLKTINQFVFNDCTRLVDIFIPETINYMGWYIFNGCTEIIVYVQKPSKPSNWSGGWSLDVKEVVWNYNQ